MECYTAIQKKRNVAICNNMDRTRGYVASEISQSDKDNYHRISLIWVISEVMYSYQPWPLLCCQLHGVKEFLCFGAHNVQRYNQQLKGVGTDQQRSRIFVCYGS